MIKKSIPNWVIPLALLSLTLVTYGPLINQLGLYWDDWVFAWTRSRMGLPGLVALFEITRPIRGWIEAILTPLLGINLTGWQAYALLMRGLAAVYFWWFLLQIWPDRKVEAFFAASLLVVYPGYTQQSQAMTYHYYWTFQGFLFLSFGLMVRALRRRGRITWWMYLLSIALCALQLASMEYLLGIEILRPVLLWIAFSPQFPDLKERLKRTVLYEIPFALVLAAYLYWRFFLYSHSIYSPVLLDEVGSSPISGLTGLLGTTVNAIYAVVIQAWAQVFHLPSVEDLGLALSWIYGLAFILIIVVWTVLLHSADNDGQPVTVPWIWVWFGLGGMFVAGLPFLIAGLPIRITFPENRAALPFIPLVSMFMAGLLNLIPGRSRQFLVASILIAFAAGFQIQTSDIYRDQYKLSKSFFWQLSWRAPGLKPGTNVLSQDDQTFLFDDDEALSIPLNWIYAPAQTVQPLPYKYQFISIRLGKELDSLLATPKTSNSIVVRFTQSSCLHVLDPIYDHWLSSLPHNEDVKLAASIGLPMVPGNTLRALPLSNTSQILTSDGTQPLTMPELLGEEPEHRWCYTYEKADLARQLGAWEDVARLGDQAFAIPLLPDDDYEYLPFIEAYARLGRIKDARLLTRQVVAKMPLMKPALCAVWIRAEQQAGISSGTAAEMKSELQTCPVP